MKALVYDGARKVRVKNVPDAKIEQPTDVLVKITTTNICGSDLHMYEGRVLGHENLGQVIESGKAKPSFIISHELPLIEAPEVTNVSTRAKKAGRKSF